VGEYTVTKENAGTPHDDTVVVFRRVGPAADQTRAYIPYRAFVPKATEGLLVAGRCFSSDSVANDMLNLIPHCVAMGEAVGTAAALAAKHNISARNVDVGLVQANMAKLGFAIPAAPQPAT
jgi:hypothetical protein